jgi:hypothetical protein
MSHETDTSTSLENYTPTRFFSEERPTILLPLRAFASLRLRVENPTLALNIQSLRKIFNAEAQRRKGAEGNRSSFA